MADVPIIPKSRAHYMSLPENRFYFKIYPSDDAEKPVEVSVPKLQWITPKSAAAEAIDAHNALPESEQDPYKLSRVVLGALLPEYADLFAGYDNEQLDVTVGLWQQAGAMTLPEPSASSSSSPSTKGPSKRTSSTKVSASVRSGSKTSTSKTSSRSSTTAKPTPPS